MTIYLYKKTHNKTGLMYLGKTIRMDPHVYQGSGDIWKPHIKKHGYDVTTEILRECETTEELKEWGLYYSNLWNVVNERDENGNKTWANLKPEEGDGGATVWGDNHPMKNPEYREKISGENHYSKKPGYEWKLKGTSHPMKDPKITAKVSGEFHHSYDPLHYTFYHSVGIIEHCTTHQLREKYNIGVALRQVILGKARSYKGWRITSELKQHACKNKPKSTAHKIALGEAKMGTTLSECTKRKQSDSKKGKPKPIITCPQCGKVGGEPQMKRYHYDNCKILN